MPDPGSCSSPAQTAAAAAPDPSDRHSPRPSDPKCLSAIPERKRILVVSPHKGKALAPPAEISSSPAKVQSQSHLGARQGQALRMCFGKHLHHCAAFLLTRCPPPEPQGLHPKPGPANPWGVPPGTSALPPQRGDHQTASHARSREHPLPKKAAAALPRGGWGARKRSNHNKNPPSLFIRQQNLSACSPSHLSPHTK